MEADDINNSKGIKVKVVLKVGINPSSELSPQKQFVAKMALILHI